MSVTLSVTDNRTESGAFAVTGATGGGTVFATAFRGETGSIGRVSIGTFTGTGGTSTFSLKRGHYLFQAVDTLAESALFYLPITNQTLSFATRCREAIAARLLLLALPKIKGIHQHFSPNETLATYPCIFVHVRDVQESNITIGGTNATTDWGHSIRITLADRVDPRDSKPLPEFELWREKIRHAFDRQRLPGVPQVNYTEYVPGTLAQPYVTPSDSYLMTGSDLTIRCITREQRGFGQ